ncbi:MAG: RNA polymerase subunit sigma-24 [Microbispora sp.]|nr:RNA polymerase subunit sigma-24 [Microbispora sp.]
MGGSRGPEASFRGDLHYADLLAYVRRRTESPEDAADALAETFATAWRRIGDVPAGPPARLWLYGVARRVLANGRRAGTSRSTTGRAALRAIAAQPAGLPARRGEGHRPRVRLDARRRPAAGVAGGVAVVVAAGGAAAVGGRRDAAGRAGGRARLRPPLRAARRARGVAGGRAGLRPAAPARAGGQGRCAAPGGAGRLTAVRGCGRPAGSP